MFHVEHCRESQVHRRIRPRQYFPPASADVRRRADSSQTDLSVQADENDNAEEDRGEENLYDVVVEDLLIGVGREVNVTFSLVRGFPVNGRIGGGWVLLCVHDDSPCEQDFSCILRTRNPAQTYSWGVPLFHKSRVPKGWLFITKDLRRNNTFLTIFCKQFARRELPRVDVRPVIRTFGDRELRIGNLGGRLIGSSGRLRGPGPW
jgi:hypothetical protein